MAGHIDRVIDDRPVPAALHCTFQPSLGGDVRGIGFCHPQPVLFAFLTEVAPDNETAPAFQEDADVPGGVVPGIKPEEQGFIRQLAAEADGLLQELVS